MHIAYIRECILTGTTSLKLIPNFGTPNISCSTLVRRAGGSGLESGFYPGHNSGPLHRCGAFPLYPPLWGHSELCQSFEFEKHREKRSVSTSNPPSSTRPDPFPPLSSPPSLLYGRAQRWDLFPISEASLSGDIAMELRGVLGIDAEHRRTERVFALKDAGVLDENATAYVSLVPCSHCGQTPPCTEALLKSKVKRVDVDIVDPNPIVASKGVSKLRAAGVEVTVGVEGKLCKNLNEALYPPHASWEALC
ncbi:hypothetical protein CRG98_035488 [Punica granatum]|uniref:CMP/dCMP-type deaminase domain-containing protein n=1 Tax=Punica granatum TaxID=22663 RepID=A0A2I0IJH9_PUNGR|nr:hypothetical protein CRG98_035488 [Punica granatum]